jgi:hypothetical protein
LVVVAVAGAVGRFISGCGFLAVVEGRGFGLGLTGGFACPDFSSGFVSGSAGFCSVAGGGGCCWGCEVVGAVACGGTSGFFFLQVPGKTRRAIKSATDVKRWRIVSVLKNLSNCRTDGGDC